MTLKFEFINHSCFILTNNNITLAVDPWLEGSVFNKSWELLVDTPKSSLGNVKNCDYIWFSHEHPDHFNPQDVKKFPTDKKYLFQKRPGQILYPCSIPEKNLKMQICKSQHQYR